MIVHCQQPIPIIFDTDIGSDIDDALALESPELDVRAVTTVTDDTVGRSRLAWKELGLYGRRDIPLATGASETLMGPALTQPERLPKGVTASTLIARQVNVREFLDLLVERLAAPPRGK